MKKDAQKIINELSFHLRAPLGNIIGFSQTLMKTERPETETEFLQAINDSGKLILKILEEKLGNDFVSINFFDKSGIQPLSRLHFKEIQQLRLLLVEDDILNVKLIEHQFSQYGMKTDVARNGRDAVEKMSVAEYDIVLMDIEMPDMNGYDTTLYIRETLKSKIPVIALTAHASITEKEKALSVGINGYLTKPVDLGRLLEIIYSSITLQSPIRGSVNIPLTDFSYLHDSLQGKKEAIKEMLDYIQQQVPVYLSELGVAVEKSDKQAIAKLAHKIKSAVLLMGITQLSPVLNELEFNEVNRIPPEKIEKLNNNLNQICSQAMEEVKKERAKFI